MSVEVVGGRFERVDIDDDWRREINPGSLAQAVLMANAVAVAGGLGLDCDPAVVRDYSPGQSATMMADIIAQAKVDSAEPVVDPGLATRLSQALALPEMTSDEAERAFARLDERQRTGITRADQGLQEVADDRGSVRVTFNSVGSLVDIFISSEWAARKSAKAITSRINELAERAALERAES